MREDADRALAAALRTLAPPGVGVAHRAIVDGDETALMRVEMPSFAGRGGKVRRQSGAARIAARGLFLAAGQCEPAIPRAATGAPVWPSGFVGSLAHDHEVALAAIARSAAYEALGIDVEPAEPLPRDLVEIVSTPAERVRHPTALIGSRAFFVIKEAIYKACHPLDGVFLDFHDIEVDLGVRRATTRTGHAFEIAVIMAPRVAGLAFRRR